RCMIATKRIIGLGNRNQRSSSAPFMPIRSYLLSTGATSLQRAQLSSQPQPLLNPLAQDYAAWRLRSLRRSCLAMALFYGLGVYAGEPVATVEFGLRHPTALEAWLQTGLTYYLHLLVAAFCVFLLTSTWFWNRVRRSRILARSAWIVGFLGPMPLFL